MTYDLISHIKRQRAFSRATFGPGLRTQGVLDHIRKETTEVEKAPTDLSEWVDLILLSIDGAWRAGHSPEDIAAAIEAKQTKNENRNWPDWRTADPNKAIEHDRTGDKPTTAGNTLCRNWLRANGLPYPRSSCHSCGTVIRPNFSCPNGFP